MKPNRTKKSSKIACPLKSTKPNKLANPASNKRPNSCKKSLKKRASVLLNLNNFRRITEIDSEFEESFDTQLWPGIYKTHSYTSRTKQNLKTRNANKKKKHGENLEGKRKTITRKKSAVKTKKAVINNHK